MKSPKVLLTGGNGFLGRLIKSRYKDITSLGKSNLNEIECDLSEEIPKLNSQYEVIIHAAGAVHLLPKTKQEEQSFFEINVRGTKNLLTALEGQAFLPKSFVFISSVSVYGMEEGTGISENSLLNATTSYGLSKIEAECLIQGWCTKNNVTCSILRLPLVVALNPPGNLKLMIDSIKSGYYHNVSGGKARKSMVLAEDVADIIPKLAVIGGTYNLTDGYHPSFYELSHLIARQCGKKSVPNLPFWLARILASFGDFISVFPLNSPKLKKITADLTFDDTKAREILNWKPNKVLDKFEVR